MGKRFYVVLRDLHLCVGLFLSPFVLVFAVSVFYLVHPRAAPAAASRTRVVADVPVTDELARLSGREQVDGLRRVLDRLGVKGEIGFVASMPPEHRIVVPVLLPGRETTVELDLRNRTATVSEQNTGVPGALILLHKMPGPHNANIRGNSAYIGIWRWLADVTAYGWLFLTFSGVYLWAVLRAERRVGLVLLSAGAISFFGIVYALAH